MRTVAWLKAELAKFPDDAICYAYEGEVIGLIIERARSPNGKRHLSEQGVIYLSEDDAYDARHPTKLLEEKKQ